jgi:hypothetical protein
MPWLSYWFPFVPSKATLALLFKAAKRRLTDQADDIAELPNARIVSATKEMNQIADDVRDAQATPEDSASTVPAPEVRANARDG